MVATSSSSRVARSSSETPWAASLARVATSSASVRLRLAISATAWIRCRSLPNARSCSCAASAMRLACAVASAVAATIASSASSAAAERSSTPPTFTWPRRICSTTSPTSRWMSCTRPPASSAALPLCSASRRTSSATTANPLPCFPARAASIAAFSASRLVMSASSRIDAMNPVIRRLSWPSACTLAELSPTKPLRATSRSMASRICWRFLLATSLAVLDARAASLPSSDTRRVGYALVAADVVDRDRRPALHHLAAQRHRVRRRLASERPADRAPIGQAQLALVAAIDAEVAPVHEPMRQALDARERVLQADVARDHGFHRVELVQLFGRDRLVEHPLDEQSQERDQHAHDAPHLGGPGDDRPDDRAARDDGRAVADALVAQDEHALAALELGPQDETEVEEDAAEGEVGDGVREQGQQQLDAQARRGEAERLDEGRVHAERRDQRHDFPAGVDHRGARCLALPGPVRAHRAGGDGERRRRQAHQQAAGERHEPRLGEIGVLAERDLRTPQSHAARREEQQLEGLAHPAAVGGEHGAEQHRTAVQERPAVQRDHAARGHGSRSRTARANARSSRSPAASPAVASTSTRALPTTTPSAARAAARTCAAVLMPKPAAMGSDVTARTRPTCSARSGGMRSRAPVTPRREMR